MDGFWGEALLTTAKGVPDPVTDIPPALATVKVVVPSTGKVFSILDFKFMVTYKIIVLL